MKAFIFHCLSIKLILFTLPLYASTINLECKYSKLYTDKIINKAKIYINKHPHQNSIAFKAASFIVKDSKQTDQNRVQLSIDLVNKKITDNLTGFIAMNDIRPNITEYTDHIFIEYKNPVNTDEDILIERIQINRQTGKFYGERYISDISADEVDPPYNKGELSYTMLGSCHPLKRLF